MVLGSSAFIVVPHRARHRASKILIVFPFLFEFADDSAKHTVVVFEHIILELFAPTQIAGVDFKPAVTHRVGQPKSSGNDPADTLAHSRSE